MQFPVKFHGQPPQSFHRVKAGEGEWCVPEEVPIAIVYNRRNYAVMMGTPDNLLDFAVGFSLTEEVIKDLNQVKAVDVRLSEKGADIRFKVSPSVLEKLDITLRRRNLVGASSCGLCGLENAEALFKTLPRVTDNPIELSVAAMSKAMIAMPLHQTLNQKTHSVHAAVWVTLDGVIKIIREDVGRHNALDKVLGAMALEKVDPKTGFIMMSSRCSYEIVEKAARCGVLAILSISGPTSFAIRKAKEANLAIYCRDGQGAVRLL